jgi:4-hydroxy-4-methyl-2-oxoglutarate aldolase
MDLIQKLEHCYSGAVYDVLRSMKLPKQVLPSSVRPLNLKQKLVGRVFTAAGKRDEAISEHESLLGWTGLLSKSPATSVVVCQPNDSSLAHFGELSAEAMHSRGIRGYIVDGGCRDTQFIENLQFPVFCRYFTPKDIVGRWAVESLGEPIVIGEVRICTGDYVVADRDGIVIIPTDIVELVADTVTEVMATENLVRKAIREGSDPQEAYLKYGKF